MGGILWHIHQGWCWQTTVSSCSGPWWSSIMYVSSKVIPSSGMEVWGSTGKICTGRPQKKTKLSFQLKHYEGGWFKCCRTPLSFWKCFPQEGHHIPNMRYWFRVCPAISGPTSTILWCHQINYHLPLSIQILIHLQGTYHLWVKLLDAAEKYVQFYQTSVMQMIHHPLLLNIQKHSIRWLLYVGCKIYSLTFSRTLMQPIPKVLRRPCTCWRWHGWIWKFDVLKES